MVLKIGPEWSLTDKKNLELVEPVGALEQLLLKLNIKNMNTDNLTPKKSLTASAQKERSSTLKKTSEMQKSQMKAMSNLTAMGNSSAKSVHIKQSATRSSKAAQKLMLDNLPLSKSESPDLDDDHISICSNESYRSTTSNTTIKSVASFHSERPRMNSTSIMNTTTTRTTRSKK